MWLRGTCSHGCQRRAHVRLLQDHLVPQAFQPPHQVLRQMLLVQLLQIQRTQLAKGNGRPLQQIINNNQDRMGHRHQRAFRSPPRRQAAGIGPPDTSPSCDWPPRPPAPASYAASDYPWSCDRFSAYPHFRCCPATSPPTNSSGPPLGTGPCSCRSPPGCSRRRARRCREPLPAEARLAPSAQAGRRQSAR